MLVFHRESFILVATCNLVQNDSEVIGRKGEGSRLEVGEVHVWNVT